MNLVEQLLQADEKKAEQLKRGTFDSWKLAEILGTKEAVTIEVQEIAPRRVNQLNSFILKSNGDLDFSKAFDGNLLVCAEGIVNPDLKNKELQKKFHANTPKELAEKLFGAEVAEVAEKILELSVAKNRKEEDDEIKN